jgi:hypothetical protein
MEFDKEDVIEIAKLDDESFVIQTYAWEDTAKNGKKIYSTNNYSIKDDDAKTALKKLLEAVAAECGYNYDKWGKENLNISFDAKGSKAE